MKNKCTPINSGCTGDNIHLFFTFHSVWLKYVCLWQDNVEEKRKFGEKYPKNLIALNCHWHWTIQRSKFTWNIPLEFMPRKKNWTLFGPYDLKKKKLTKTTVAPNMRMMKNVYKRYVMPLIKSKMKTVNWKKKKKFEYIMAKYLLFFLSHEKYFTEINDNK